MDTGIFVSPGDAWHPESAVRYNGVSDMLNRIGVIGPSGQRPPAGESAVITCRNTGDAVLSAGSYVTVSQDGTAMTAGCDDPCGVLLEDCAPGRTAAVQLAGLAQVAADFPRPPDVLRLSPTCVLLNSVGHSLYRNYFKVERTDTGIRIFDGGNPESQYCGLTDVGTVPVTTITGTGSLYLNLTWGNNAYAQTFSFTAGTASYLIADVLPDRIIQRWTGGVIYWRQRFCLRSLS